MVYGRPFPLRARPPCVKKILFSLLPVLPCPIRAFGFVFFPGPIRALCTSIFPFISCFTPCPSLHSHLSLPFPTFFVFPCTSLHSTESKDYFICSKTNQIILRRLCYKFRRASVSSELEISRRQSRLGNLSKRRSARE